MLVLEALLASTPLFDHYTLQDDVPRRMLPSSRPIKAH
jgi:hypothetical protein